MLEPGFEMLGHIADPGGVFVLVLKGRIVYVGQCKNLYARAAKAVVKMRAPFRELKKRTEWDFDKIPLFFDEVWVKFCGEAEAARLRLELIEKHKPEQQPPVRIKGHALPPSRFPRVDIWALAAAAGVKLERVEKTSRRVP